MENDIMKDIESLNEKKFELEAKINEYNLEIDKLWEKTIGNFEGKYIEYYSGSYTYMRVEQQVVLDDGLSVSFFGPKFVTDSSPLDDFDGVSSCAYDDWSEINITSGVISGTSSNSLREISREDMLFVVTSCTDIIKKNMI